MIWFDHAVRIVPEFARAERRLRAEYGLEAARWEEFPGSGVASRIFVLGNAGIELLGVRDAAAAADHPFGCMVRDAASQGERWLGVAIGTDALDDHANRLGLQSAAAASVSSEGVHSEFRLLGDPISNGPALPFFIEWAADTRPWPREHAALNPRFTGIKRAELSGDRGAIAGHVGDEHAFLSVVEGAPGMRAVVLATDSSEIRIE